jgi:orotate phosphoribosyltransferase
VSDHERLLELIRASVAEGPVTLSSGTTSDFYVDGRLVMLTPEGSHLAGKAILAKVQELSVSAVAGPTTGACPMVSAAGVLAAQQGVEIQLAYVRAEAKGHGMGKTIEGPPLSASDRVLFVDDVVTSGGSFVRAIERLRAETGATVTDALCLVDRQAGGAERLQAIGVTLHALMTRADVTSLRS